MYRVHCSGAPIIEVSSFPVRFSRPSLWELQNQLVAVPRVANRPCPKFPQSVLRISVAYARGNKADNDCLQTPFNQRGRFAKRWNENSLDTGQMHKVLRQELVTFDSEYESPQYVQQTSILPAYYMQMGCNRLRTSPELPQWNPLASLVTLHTVNFLIDSYATRSSPSGSLVPSAPSHI